MVFLPSLRHFSLSDVFTPVLSIFLHLSTVWLLAPLLLPVSWCFLFDIIAALVQAPSYHHFSYLSSSMYMRILLDIFSLLCFIPLAPSNYLTIPFILHRLWVASWQFLCNFCTICASWLFAFYLSFRWFEPTSSGTEAQHTINCASQTAVRVWGKIQVFINKMMNASPTKKKSLPSRLAWDLLHLSPAHYQLC